MSFTIHPQRIRCDRCGASERRVNDRQVRDWKAAHDAECLNRPAGARRLP